MNLLTAHQGNWPDARLGPFAPKDPQFPLPGNVGIELPHRRTMAEALLELESDDIRRAVVIDTYMKDVAENYEEAVETEVVNSRHRKEYLKDTYVSFQFRWNLYDPLCPMVQFRKQVVKHDNNIFFINHCCNKFPK